MSSEETMPRRPGRPEDGDTLPRRKSPKDEATQRRAPLAEESSFPPALSSDDTGSGETDLRGPFGLDRRLFAAGCAGLVVLGVLLIGFWLFFLPPLNLADQLRGCQTLNAGSPVISLPDGVGIALTSGGRLRVCPGSISREALLAGQGGREYQQALRSLPSYLELRSPLYTFEPRGEGHAVVQIPLPADAVPYQTLDLYRWDKEAGQWVFVPGHVDMAAGVFRASTLPDNVALFQTRRPASLIGTTLEAGQALDVVGASTLNLIMPAGITLRSDGVLEGALIGGWELGAGYAVVPVIRTAEGVDLRTLRYDQAGLALHIEDLKNLAVSGGYHGVAIDYPVNPPDREAFTAFITGLADALHQHNKLLIVILPRPSGSAMNWDTGGYDWQAIGAVADAVVIEAGDNPVDYAVNGSAVTLLGWAVGEISRFKVYLAMSASSVQDAGGDLTLISYDEALAPLGSVTVSSPAPASSDAYLLGTEFNFGLSGSVADLTADQNTGAYTYTLDGGQRRIWIVTANTIRARLDMAAAYNIGGMVINNLLSEGNDAGLETAINEFKANNASTVPSQLAMQWTVSGASGAVLSQSTGIGTPLVWRADAPGDYTVQGQIVGGRVSDRGAVAVRVVPPDTPTPLPNTPQATVRPSNTNPGATTAPPATQAATAPPVSGQVTGALEIGGQVPGFISHGSLMHYAGMNWVKFQIAWTPGMDPSSAAGAIAAGHGAGFKVLLSIAAQNKYPGSIDFASFSAFLGGVAALGPDAIEVWNEPNINREWPTGQINGANYVTNMLAPAYQAIKAANPNVMVISAAPAPTGYWGACAPEGCDDWLYIAQMRDAGAASYLDCVGIHYNEGIIPPSQTSGDPRSEHYTRYFFGMLNLYYSTLGKPLCFTELGYLTPEGYGTLPAGFSWAQNTTVAQQAAWLAEAAVLASQSGKVRLMIIFNVDFTVWGDDPQAGYAIIRPGGGCPACDAVHAVLP